MNYEIHFKGCVKILSMLNAISAAVVSGFKSRLCNLASSYEIVNQLSL